MDNPAETNQSEREIRTDVNQVKLKRNMTMNDYLWNNKFTNRHSSQ